MNQIKKFLKAITPKFVLSSYHWVLARLAQMIFGNPSEKLIVIGVTGTNGKSTTVNLISKILEGVGCQTALTSTVNFKIASNDKLNDLKMTMPGRFFLQGFLKRALHAGCQFAIIESSSEGILQSRHLGIHYDAFVFTNLTPEHLEAHGGFGNYKQAKLTYFQYLLDLPHKIINGKKIEKIIAVNLDDPYGFEFAKFRVDKVITYGGNLNANIRAEDPKVTPQGVSFKINGIDFQLQLKGKFDIYNALAAIALTSGLGINLEVAKQALEKVAGIPGRMELIEEGQSFKVLVDYAPEPESLKQLYLTLAGWSINKKVHVLGSTGGGRDVSRRKILGQLAAENSDYVIVTNEDPYDDDPQQIIDDVAAGALENGKILGQSLFKILDRSQAINKALSLAQANDLVIITGKGSEQKMAVSRGQYIDWDDRKVVREELEQILENNRN